MYRKETSNRILGKKTSHGNTAWSKDQNYHQTSLALDRKDRTHKGAKLTNSKKQSTRHMANFTEWSNHRSHRRETTNGSRSETGNHNAPWRTKGVARRRRVKKKTLTLFAIAITMQLSPVKLCFWLQWFCCVRLADICCSYEQERNQAPPVGTILRGLIFHP